LVVVPSSAVTIIVIVLSPTFIDNEPDAEPDVTVVPLTVIVACDSSLVGVTVIDVVALDIDAVYDVVLLANVGDNVPLDNVNVDKLALLEILCAVIVYVLVVVPSSAVTTIVTVLSPTFKLIEPDAESDDTVTVLTVIVACDSVLVGVTVIEDVPFVTLTVYDVVAESNEGDSVPLEVVNADNVASTDIL
jgi:hypothetical protein